MQRQRGCRLTGECGGCSQSGSGSALDVCGSFSAVSCVTSQATSPHVHHAALWVPPPAVHRHTARIKGRVRRSWWATVCLPVCVFYHRERLVTCATSTEGSSAKWEVRKGKKIY